MASESSLHSDGLRDITDNAPHACCPRGHATPAPEATTAQVRRSLSLTSVPNTSPGGGSIEMLLYRGSPVQPPQSGHSTAVLTSSEESSPADVSLADETVDSGLHTALADIAFATSLAPVDAARLIIRSSMDEDVPFAVVSQSQEGRTGVSTSLRESSADGMELDAAVAGGSSSSYSRQALPSLQGTPETDGTTRGPRLISNPSYSVTPALPTGQASCLCGDEQYDSYVDRKCVQCGLWQHASCFRFEKFPEPGVDRAKWACWRCKPAAFHITDGRSPFVSRAGSIISRCPSMTRTGRDARCRCFCEPLAGKLGPDESWPCARP